MSPSNNPTPSMSPAAGVPPAGNGKYIVVFVGLVAAIGGLIAWKSCGNQAGPPAQTTISKFDAAPTPHDDDNSVPLPPPPDEPAADSGGPQTRVNGTWDPCAVKTCSGGKTTDELETALGYRAKQAHRCYDQALAQDSDLKGHVTIAVRVASNGTLCSANVAANDMGSDGVATCVANVFRSSRTFPAPKGGCIDVKVPINFVPGGK